MHTQLASQADTIFLLLVIYTEVQLFTALSFGEIYLYFILKYTIS